MIEIGRKIPLFFFFVRLFLILNSVGSFVNKKEAQQEICETMCLILIFSNPPLVPKKKVAREESRQKNVRNNQGYSQQCTFHCILLRCMCICCDCPLHDGKPRIWTLHEPEHSNNLRVHRERCDIPQRSQFIHFPHPSRHRTVRNIFFHNAVFYFDSE